MTSKLKALILKNTKKQTGEFKYKSTYKKHSLFFPLDNEFSSWLKEKSNKTCSYASLKIKSLKITKQR